MDFFYKNKKVLVLNLFFFLLLLLLLVTNRINLRIKRKEQRCRPLQAGQMRRKESWLLRTPWIPAASARHLLCPARTPSLLRSDVRSVYCYIHSCERIKQICYSVFFSLHQPLNLEQAQLCHQHLMLSRRQLRGCPRCLFRSTYLLTAPERGFWDYWRPCYHLSNQ